MEINNCSIKNERFNLDCISFEINFKSDVIINIVRIIAEHLNKYNITITGEIEKPETIKSKVIDSFNSGGFYNV